MIIFDHLGVDGNIEYIANYGTDRKIRLTLKRGESTHREHTENYTQLKLYHTVLNCV
jgi:hypothetical protein